MRRTVYGPEHEQLRGTVRSFLEREVVPVYADFEAAGSPSREFFRRAGEVGLLGMQVPEEYGGAGERSFKYNAVVTEEIQALGLALGGLRLHTDICMPYFLAYTSDEQRTRWLPRLASGDAIAAIAMSEPGAGSDLRGITTSATRTGTGFVVRGAKTFISNGSLADLIITVVRTAPGKGQGTHSLLVVERGTPGFSVGRRMNKIGLKAQDVTELFFDDVEVPAENLLGEEGHAFEYLTANLAQERMSIALNGQAAAEHALDVTLEYVKDRTAFGTSIGSFQNTKFELAACATDIAAGRSLADRGLEALDAGELSASDAAMIKLYCTELQGRVADRCLQLHGGYGYSMEFPIARSYVDARVARIYGGSSEIMKVIIAKQLGL
jgi:acyl-CoA dehydrogenase